MEWNKDMDAAPRDGSEVLLYCWGDMAVCCWVECLGIWYYGGTHEAWDHDLEDPDDFEPEKYTFHGATHWRHLPEPPNDI